MPKHRSSVQGRLVLLAVVVLFLLVFGRSICSLFIDYLWWKEMGQVATWVRGLSYVYATNVAEWLLAFVVLWIAHARGVRYAGARLGDHRIYSRIATLVLAFVALLIAGVAMNGWVVARYAAGSGVPSTWTDPAFGRPLSFYFFELPFYTGVLELHRDSGRRRRPGVLSGRAPAGRSGASSRRWPPPAASTWTACANWDAWKPPCSNFWWPGSWSLWPPASGWTATRCCSPTTARCSTGMDYIQQNLGIPFQYAKAGAAVLAAILVLSRKRLWAIACAVVLILDFAVPPLVSNLYVKPNELTLERPYLRRHIEATRTAYGLATNEHELSFDAHNDGPIDFTRNESLLDNVRLWDWRAFHDTLSQTQPSRPYAYADTDVDRYMIDGKMRQTLLAPRELDLGQLGDAQNSWINVNVTYTHGYGLVLAQASRISPAGLPELLIRDAPPMISTPSLKLTRPEIYFGEQAHEPVFAPSAQLEFNYQAKPDNKIHYDGDGRFPHRLAAAAHRRRDRGRRLEHFPVRCHPRRHPHDDSSQGAGPAGHSGRVHPLGSGSLHGDRPMPGAWSGSSTAT